MLALGHALGEVVRPGDVIALVGDLGAGKTVLARGIARGLGVAPKSVSSPTFTLVNLLTDGRVPLCHADLYRLERDSDLVETGLDDVIRGEDHVVVIEWADRFESVSRDACLTLRLGGAAEGPRTLRIETRDRGDALVSRWRQAMQK